MRAAHTWHAALHLAPGRGLYIDLTLMRLLEEWLGALCHINNLVFIPLGLVDLQHMPQNHSRQW